MSKVVESATTKKAQWKTPRVIVEEVNTSTRAGALPSPFGEDGVYFPS